MLHSFSTASLINIHPPPPPPRPPPPLPPTLSFPFTSCNGRAQEEWREAHRGFDPVRNRGGLVQALPLVAAQVAQDLLPLIRRCVLIARGWRPLCDRRILRGASVWCTWRGQQHGRLRSPRSSCVCENSVVPAAASGVGTYVSCALSSRVGVCHKVSS